jgi:hypothetical protein
VSLRYRHFVQSCSFDSVRSENLWVGADFHIFLFFRTLDEREAIRSTLKRCKIAASNIDHAMDEGVQLARDGLKKYPERSCLHSLEWSFSLDRVGMASSSDPQLDVMGKVNQHLSSKQM